VVPSISIRAEPPEADVDKNVEREGTRAAAGASCRFLYTREAQEIIADQHYRPTNEAVADKHADQFSQLRLLSIDDAVFGGWGAVHRAHFADGGTFDQIYGPKAR